MSSYCVVNDLLMLVITIFLIVLMAIFDIAETESHISFYWNFVNCLGDRIDHPGELDL